MHICIRTDRWVGRKVVGWIVSHHIMSLGRLREILHDDGFSSGRGDQRNYTSSL